MPLCPPKSPACRSLPARNRITLLAGFLLLLLLAGAAAYVQQLREGLCLTGLGRDLSWGLYIAQFTCLVGIAASSAAVTLPALLTQRPAFQRLVVFGEGMAVSAMAMSLLFIFVDLGQPLRVLNVLLHPSPRSIMFWDMLALAGYLALNICLGRTALRAEAAELPPPAWLRPLGFFSVAWAVAIHTVTAFLYAGLPGRPFWLTALLAARFLASACSSGPALFLLLTLALKKHSPQILEDGPRRTLTLITACAAWLNLFFLLLELFTAFYSGIPAHQAAFRHLLGGGTWITFFALAGALCALLAPALFTLLKRQPALLPWTLGLALFAVWSEKGLSLVIGGFAPTPFGSYAAYAPTLTELTVSAGIYAAGGLLLLWLWRRILHVRAKAPLPDAAAPRA